MRVPIIENVNKWKEHFEKMAKGKTSSNSMRCITGQKGRGAVGNNYRDNKKMFTIQSGEGGSSFSDAPVISPVKGALEQTKSELKIKKRAIKGPTKRKAVSRKKVTPRSNIKKKKVTKTPVKKKKTAKKTTVTKRKKTVTKRKPTPKKKKRKTTKKKDIFVCVQR